MLAFTLDQTSPVPAYQQVVQAIKMQIMSGKLQDGDTLPSIRDLARYLKLNPNTVAKAYYTLETDGLLESRVGSGCRVKAPRPSHDALRRQLLQTEFRRFLEQAFALGFTRDDVLALIHKEWSHE